MSGFPAQAIPVATRTALAILAFFIVALLRRRSTVSSRGSEIEVDTHLGLISPPPPSSRMKLDRFWGVEGLAGMHPIEQLDGHPGPLPRGQTPM